VRTTPSPAEELNVALALLISDSSRPGSVDLANTLASLMNLETIPPVFCAPGALQDESVVDAATFQAHHLRNPTTGEVGCALAHRSAYERFLQSDHSWCLIFEDDAQILDFELLHGRIHEYERLCQVSNPVVINLNQNAQPQRVTSGIRDVHGLRRSYVPSLQTTAYAINAAAARLFVEVQTPIRNQADWPATTREVSFFIDTHSGVRENLELGSTIDAEDGRVKIRAARKLQSWSALWYVRQRRHFNGFRHYWEAMLKPRIYWHINALLVRAWQR